jgi:hypothetical protein
VFEPFYQVEKTLSREHGGTGLGLAICRGIVESQKGKIWIESELGKGSMFKFTVPLNPVHDIEPIRVLFSPKAVIERKVKEAFKTALGPMGEVEFDDLKNKNALWKDEIITYIDTLHEQGILTVVQREAFKSDIRDVFGEETQWNEATVPQAYEEVEVG